MTTNRPEVKRYDCTSNASYHCHGCFTMNEHLRGNYVEWGDYEALQAECERWKNSASGAHQQLTADRIETEKLAAYWGEVMAESASDVNEAERELETVKAECEKLQKDAERYRYIKEGNQWIVAATQTGYHLGGEDLDDLIDSEMGQQK